MGKGVGWEPRGISNKSLVYTSEKSIVELMSVITGTVPLRSPSDLTRLTSLS